MGSTDENLDRPLTGRDLEHIANGFAPKGGNGSYIPFDQLPPETLRQYREKAIANRRAKKDAERIATLEGFIDAHRAKAADLFGAQLSIIEGLMAEATGNVKNKKTGEVTRTFRTQRLSDARLKILLAALKQFEVRGFGAPAAKVEHEHSGQVDVFAQFSEVQRAIEGDVVDAEVVDGD